MPNIEKIQQIEHEIYKQSNLQSTYKQLMRRQILNAKKQLK